MNELSKLITNAMDNQDIGVNELARRAKERGYPLSASKVSNYRRDNLPKVITDETLKAFNILLGIPLEDLRHAAYGEDAAEVDERVSLAQAISELHPRHRSLIRQLIQELNFSKESNNVSEPHPDQRHRHLRPFEGQDSDAEDSQSEQKIPTPDPELLAAHPDLPLQAERDDEFFDDLGEDPQDS